MQLELSILIPVYNFYMGQLVMDLISQLQNSGLNFEIRLYDDCSKEEYRLENRKLASISGVIYTELPKNLGRSKIRNLLAKEALFENLLFLDCDNELVNDNYISFYTETLKLSTWKVIIGGRKYKPFHFYSQCNRLHWLAGKKKEEKTAEVRSRNAYDFFLLDNLLIKKTLFLSILLDENIKTYGHEDTKFGFVLKQRNISIVNVDNPTYHIGLSNSTEFLQKTKLAVRVLHNLIEKEKIGEGTKLYKIYLFIDRLRLIKVSKFILKKLEPFILYNLNSNRPSLLLFDLYKLNEYLKL